MYAKLDFWTWMIELELIELNYLRKLKSVLQANAQLAQNESIGLQSKVNQMPRFNSGSL